MKTRFLLLLALVLFDKRRAGREDRWKGKEKPADNGPILRCDPLLEKARDPACISHVVEEHRSGHPVDQKDIIRRAAMRIVPIAVALGLMLAGPALAASESAKMKGQDQNATEPARHPAQSAKMHKQHQNPSFQSGSGTVNTEGTMQK
jgi:hypothetical protein